MKALKLYRESNGTYSTNLARRENIEGWYVKSTDYADLLEKNAELRAEIECLRGHAVILEDSIDEDSDITAFVCDARKASVQHLADIKADAVVEAAIALCIQGNSVKSVGYTDLVNYANNLRGEAK